ncbi:zinc finger BED domain-containing protein RICESLEEPER 2 [Tanacetum coccineum]
MTRDLLSVQASTVASESAFLVRGRVISPRRTKLTPVSVEVCICLKDHLDTMERIDVITLEGDLDGTGFDLVINGALGLQAVISNLRDASISYKPKSSVDWESSTHIVSIFRAPENRSFRPGKQLGLIFFGIVVASLKAFSNLALTSKKWRWRLPFFPKALSEVIGAFKALSWVKKDGFVQMVVASKGIWANIGGTPFSPLERTKIVYHWNRIIMGIMVLELVSDQSGILVLGILVINGYLLKLKEARIGLTNILPTLALLDLGDKSSPEGQLMVMWRHVHDGPVLPHRLKLSSPWNGYARPSLVLLAMSNVEYAIMFLSNAKIATICGSSFLDCGVYLEKITEIRARLISTYGGNEVRIFDNVRFSALS